jgi:hypothetical protein
MEEGPEALDRFTRGMKALFRVPKSAVLNDKHKPKAPRKPRKP